MQTIVFYILAAVILGGAILTVTSRNILRAAVYLLFVLAATSGIYFMMNYNFLAAVQLTVYAGGIVVLIIFSILLTHQINTRLEAPSLKKILIALVASAGGFVLVNMIINAHTFNPTGIGESSDMESIGNALMSYGENGYVLPFEVISVLLLAAMVAAITIAKRKVND